jgi:hypothetical protein
MTDKKNGPGPKTGPAKNGDRPNPDGGSAKRPFATIDLKAVEVPADAQKTGPAPPRPAMPPGQAEAARRVAAAAAATRVSASSSVPASSGGKDGPPKAASETGAPAPRDQKAATGANKPASTASAASAPNPTATPATGSAGRGRSASHLLSGVAGAALTLLAAPFVLPVVSSVFEQSGLHVPPPAVSPELANRLAAMERKLAAPPVVDPARDPVRAIAEATANRERIEQLSRSLASLTEAHTRTMRMAAEAEARMARQPPIADVGDRIVKLEGLLSELAAIAQAEPDRAGRVPQLAQIVGRIADLETAVATRVAEVRKDVARDLDQRIAVPTEASEAARSATQRLDREVGGIKSETNRLATDVDQVKTGSERLALTLKAAQDETAKLATALDGVRREMEARLASTAKPQDVSAAISPLMSKLASLENNLTTVVKSETDRNTTAERIVLSLELGNLKRAMERGAPYAQELAEVKKIAGNRLDLAPLERYRTEGVPTLPELVQAFRPVANAILDAEAEKTDGSVVDRLLSGAKTFVRVRKTTHASGDSSPEAVVARMEEALKSGRLGDVLGEAKSIERKPDVAREWVAKVEARHVVDAALRSIDAALKASLGAGPAPASQPKGQK